jgi:hypothetical protein
MRSTADLHSSVSPEESVERSVIRFCGELSIMLNEALTQPDPIARIQSIADRLDVEKGDFAKSVMANIKQE